MQSYRRLKHGWIVQLDPGIKAMLDRIVQQSHFTEEEVIAAGIRLMAAYTGAKSHARPYVRTRPFNNVKGVVHHVASKKSMAAKR